MIKLLNADVIETLHNTDNNSFDMIFADPPDNIGLGYNDYKDDLTVCSYYRNLRIVILESLRIAPIVWLSYYWKHDVDIKHLMYQLREQHYPSVKIKTFIWRFTFGQHQKTDCGSGFRFLVRLTKTSAKLYPDNIREMSERQRIGDKRADERGRVPDDVWQFPRVVGNAYERRKWHPTQHPEALLKRIIMFSTVEGDEVLDLYTGTGTTLRVCKSIGRSCTGVEIDSTYCETIRKELEL